MELNLKIGIIGTGNMGRAILAGVLGKGIARPSQVCIYDKIAACAEQTASSYRVQNASGIKSAVEVSDVLVLAVKPQDLAGAASEMKPYLKKSHVVISILAGIARASIRKAVGDEPGIVRAMPNLGATVGEGVTALCGGGEDRLKIAEAIFSGCGKTLRADESLMDLITAVSGSGPAYYFLLTEILIREGVRGGLTEEDARLLAVQTAAGAAKLAQQSQDSPEELRKRVTSKGGTTEAALKVLEDQKIRLVFQQAVEAAVRRGRELGRLQ